jgi:hypothetical protein
VKVLYDLFIIKGQNIVRNTHFAFFVTSFIQLATKWAVDLVKSAIPVFV